MSSKIVGRILAHTILALPLIIIAVVTYTVYNPTEVTPLDVERVNDCLDMPLDKVTIWLNAKDFEKAVEKSTWAKVGSTLFSSSIKIEAKDPSLYVINVGLDRVKRLISIAEHSGITMDGDAITLPTKDKRVLVPTWIVYALAADNCFNDL